MIPARLLPTILLLSAIAVPAAEPAAQAGPGNAAAITQFGIDIGDPISSGFFFVDAAYIALPYRVERRGLEILINGHLVRPGAEWPPFDEKVENDPGDPPPGLSPFADEKGDFRNGYWDRKYRYLRSHNDAAKTRDLMIEAYRKSGLFTAVTADKTYPMDVTVTENNGHTVAIELEDPSDQNTPSPPQELLERAAASKKSIETKLRNGGIIGIMSKGGEWQINGNASRAFVEVLCSPLSRERKVDALIEKKLIMPKDEQLRSLFSDIPITDELRLRAAGRPVPPT